MRSRFSERVERGRELHGDWGSNPGDDYGRFRLVTNGPRPTWLVVVVSGGSEEIPWQHVSVSCRDRTPTWAEMCWIKDLFFEEEELVVQYHPPKSKYVNLHPYCLHLWRPNHLEMPAPPELAVGPRTEADIEALRAIDPEHPWLTREGGP